MRHVDISATRRTANPESPPQLLHNPVTEYKQMAVQYVLKDHGAARDLQGHLYMNPSGMWRIDCI